MKITTEIYPSWKYWEYRGIVTKYEDNLLYFVELDEHEGTLILNRTQFELDIEYMRDIKLEDLGI